MLVEHRVDNMGEGLVTVEEAVPSGEEISLKPPLTQVFGEYFHHPALGAQMFIGGFATFQPYLVGAFVDRRQAIGCRLIGAH
ncbi:Uncharacterised protein [Mycobacteroides abscessus subsp. abscessus]|nr:Uncharacterised protein [Mycobacteroides abscessus subsp. abscessus]